MDRRHFLTLLGSLGAAGTVAACSSSGGAGGSDSGANAGAGGTLAIDAGAEIGDRLGSPWMGNGTLDNVALYSTLLLADHTLAEFQPDLAESWEYSNDDTTLTLVLKDGLKWSDGEPFTAEDVKFSLETLLRVSQANSIYTAAFRHIDGGEAVLDGSATELPGVTIDGSTMTLALTQTYGTFVPVLAQFVILPKHKLHSADPLELHNDPFFRDPVGTGMYKLKEFNTGNFYSLEPNPNYHGEAPKLKELQFVASSDKVADATSGRLDYFTTNVPEVVQGMADSPTMTANPVETLFYRYLIFNASEESLPAANVKFREALTKAVDYEPLVTALYSDQATMISSGVPDGDPMSAKLPGFAFSASAAKSLLDGAGYDYSKKLRLRYYYDDATSRNLMTAIAQGLEAIGVQTDVQQFQGDVTTELYTNRNWDVALKGLSSFGLEEWYSEYVGANFRAIIGEQPQYSTLIDRLATETEDSARRGTLDELQRLERSDLFKVPLFTIKQFIYVAKKVDTAGVTFGSPFYRYNLKLGDWTM